MARTITYTLAIAVLLAVLFSTGASWSKAGSPIPVPKVTATAAIKLATRHFLDKETRAVDTGDYKKSEYILTLAQYTNRFGEKSQKTWAWKIRFVHPVANDHSVEYKVTSDRKVIFLQASE